MAKLPVHLLEPGTDPTELPAGFGQRSRWRSLLLWGGLTAVGILAALWWFRLPPFSPPSDGPVLAAHQPGPATPSVTYSPTLTVTVRAITMPQVGDYDCRPPLGWQYQTHYRRWVAQVSPTTGRTVYRPTPNRPVATPIPTNTPRPAYPAPPKPSPLWTPTPWPTPTQIPKTYRVLLPLVVKKPLVYRVVLPLVFKGYRQLHKTYLPLVAKGEP